MSSVILQVGQCGNQIGQEFWKIAKQDETKATTHVYHHGDRKLRSVHVDSEPKVLQRILRESQAGDLRPGNVIRGKRGRGTNWALGYHGNPTGGEGDILGAALEAVRREAERCSSYSGSIVLHSLSGGTGSGLGSRLTEALRDEFPLHHVLNCTVAPHSSGESPLQYYNALLCLASLQRHSDGVLLFSNDEVLQRLRRRGRDEDSSVSLGNMNTYMAQALAGVCLPIDSLTPACSGVSCGQEPWELVRSVCPQPSLKLVSLSHKQQSNVSWPSLAMQATQPVPRYDPAGQPYSSLANLVVARGDTNGSFYGSQNQVVAKVMAAYNPVKWNPFPVDCWSGGSRASSVTVASNWSGAVKVLQDTVHHSACKLAAGAYLHWYTQYGCAKEDIEEAMETVQQVIEDYREAII